MQRIYIIFLVHKISHILRQIAEQVFGIKKEDNIPHSKEDLSKLSDLKTALKLLVSEKKVLEALIEDPDTQEQ